MPVSATDGIATDYHLIHLGRFVLGGFGLVIVEATGVAPEGRITHGDLGLWSDHHVEGLKRIATALKAAGAAAGIQLAHSKPLFVRVSAVDGIHEGTPIEDTVMFAEQLKQIGVDLVDCSSGGIMPRYDFPSSYGYQIGYAERVRKDVGVASAAVGLIVDPHHAEIIVTRGQADLVDIGREALFDPNWALHAHYELEAATTTDAFAYWPPQSGWWLKGHAGQINSFAVSKTPSAIREGGQASRNGVKPDHSITRHFLPRGGTDNRHTAPTSREDIAEIDHA